MEWRFSEQEENVVFTAKTPILSEFCGLKSKFYVQNHDKWPQHRCFEIRNSSVNVFCDHRRESVVRIDRRDILILCVYFHSKPEVRFYILHKRSMDVVLYADGAIWSKFQWICHRQDNFRHPSVTIAPNRHDIHDNSKMATRIASNICQPRKHL